MKRALMIGAVLLLGLTACTDPHAGQHCVHTHSVSTFIMVGKVMVPITRQECDTWEEDSTWNTTTR